MERCHPWEIFVDDVECAIGQPHQMHRVRRVTRDTLRNMFNKPCSEAAISDADDRIGSLGTVTRNVSDLVVLRESWRLPSAKDAKDGWYVATTGAGLLARERYTKDHFPFAAVRWEEKIAGFWGEGYAEQATAGQTELNKIQWVVAKTLHQMGTFKVFLPFGSRIPKDHVGNRIGTIIEGQSPPQYLCPQALQPEWFHHRENVIKDLFSLGGVSEMSAVSQKPAGLNSGKALRAFVDIESQRFAAVMQAYEQFTIGIGKLAVEAISELIELDASFAVPVGRKCLSSIDWSDVAIEEGEEYRIQCFAINSLSKEPAGRLQDVQEAMQAGLLTMEQGKRLLDFPDTDQVDSLATAAEERLYKMFDDLVDEGVPNDIDEHDNLQQAREIALQYYMEGKQYGIEFDRLDLLDQAIQKIDSLVAQMAPPTPMQGAISQAQAKPEPSPVSDLLPNGANG